MSELPSPEDAGKGGDSAASTASTVSSAAAQFLEYDEMIRKTIEATKRMNDLRDELRDSRSHAITGPAAKPQRASLGDDIELPHYDYNYVAPIEPRRVKTPTAWKRSSRHGHPLASTPTSPPYENGGHQTGFGSASSDEHSSEVRATTNSTSFPCDQPKSPEHSAFSK